MKNELAVFRLTIHRYRRLYVALAVFAAILVQLGVHYGTDFPPYLAIPLSLLYTGLLIFTLGAFANPDSDLAGDAPALPTYLLRLPVSTRSLALPPLIGSVVWTSLAWIVMSVGFLRPVGIEVPVLWPAALFGAMGPTLMAVQWAPLRSGKLRMMLGLLLPTSLVAIGLWFGGSPAYTKSILTLFFAVYTLIIGRVAYWGLAVSRISESTRVKKERKALARLQRRKTVPNEPFKSPLAAQRWLEWQRQGRILPILTATTMGLMSVPLLFERAVRPAWDPLQLSPNIWVGSAMPFLFAVPLAFATVIGMGARPNESKASDGVYHLFFATRPVQSELLVQAKNQAGIMSVLVTWGIVLLTVIGWSFTPAAYGDAEGPLWAYFLVSVTLQQFLTYSLAFAILVAWTWRNLTVGAFADYLPTRFGKRFYASFVIVVSIVVGTILNTMDMRPWIGALSFVTEMFLVLLLAMKVGLAFNLAWRTAELRPSAAKDMRRVFRNWTVGGLVASGALWTLSVQLLQAQDSQLPALFTSPVATVMAGFMLMPLSRTIATRYALEVGRHSVGEPSRTALWKNRIREKLRARKAAKQAPSLRENLAAARPTPVEALREERIVAE